MVDKFDLLLVDDEQNDLELFFRAVQRLSFVVKVATAKDGVEALEFLAEQNDEAMPRLVIADLKMPRMDGVKLIEKMRKDPRLNSVPAIVLTSSKDHKDISQAYQAGANAYLVKPVNLKDFHHQIEVTLNFWLQENHVETVKT